MRINSNKNRYSIIGNNNSIYIYTPDDYLKTDCDCFLNDISTSAIILVFLISIILILIAIYCCRCLCRHQTPSSIAMPSNIICGEDVNKHCLCINSKT